MTSMNASKLRQRFTPGVPRIFDQDCTYISFKVTLHYMMRYVLPNWPVYTL